MRYNDAETLTTVTDSTRRPSPRHSRITTTAVQAIVNADALKHTYVYSEAPGFGKSYTLARRFAKTYNAAVVADINNWTNVWRRAQFIVFDEVEHDANSKEDFACLKAITGGATTGNMMKTFGDSFILMSNESIYDVYGEWNAKLQRRFITPERIQQLEERFSTTGLSACVDERRCTTHVYQA